MEILSLDLVYIRRYRVVGLMDKGELVAESDLLSFRSHWKNGIVRVMMT